MDANNNASKCRAENGGGGVVYWTFADEIKMFELTDGDIPFDHSLFKNLGKGTEYENTAKYGPIFASSSSRLFMKKGTTSVNDISNTIRTFNIKDISHPVKTTEQSVAKNVPVISGENFSPVIQIYVLDWYGQHVKNSDISVSIHPVSGSIWKVANFTEQAVAGIVTFTNLAIQAAPGTSSALDVRSSKTVKMQYTMSCGNTRVKGNICKNGNIATKSGPQVYITLMNCTLGTYVLPNNDESTPYRCQFCPQGTYSITLNPNSCTKCPIGLFNDVDDRPTIQCKKCEVGKYQNDIGKSTCTSCSAGHGGSTR